MLSAVVLIAGVALALAAVALYRTLRQYYALREFKGPRSVGFSRLWLLWANGCGKMHLVFTEVNDKYGMRFFLHFHIICATSNNTLL